MHSRARDVQGLAHQLVAGVLAGADDQPAGKGVRADPQGIAPELQQACELSSSDQGTISTRSPCGQAGAGHGAAGQPPRRLTSTATHFAPAAPIGRAVRPRSSPRRPGGAQQLTMICHRSAGSRSQVSCLRRGHARWQAGRRPEQEPSASAERLIRRRGHRVPSHGSVIRPGTTAGVGLGHVDQRPARLQASRPLPDSQHPGDHHKLGCLGTWIVRPFGSAAAASRSAP